MQSKATRQAQNQGNQFFEWIKSSDKKIDE